jgi:hypothetical protein
MKFCCVNSERMKFVRAGTALMFQVLGMHGIHQNAKFVHTSTPGMRNFGSLEGTTVVIFCRNTCEQNKLRDPVSV